MMIGHEEILQGVRAYLLEATGNAGDHSRVIPADVAQANRPALPYLTVKILSAGHVEAAEDVVVDDGGIIKSRHTSSEYATVSVQGYGNATFAWLQMARKRLGQDRYRRVAEDAGVHLRNAAPVEDISAYVDTQTERRWLLELEAAYCAVLDEEATVDEPLAAETADIGNTFTSDAGASALTTTHDLTGAP